MFENAVSMVWKANECFDNKCEFSVNQLDVVWYLRSAWRKVKYTTIWHCFDHGGFEGSKEIVKEEQDEEITGW